MTAHTPLAGKCVLVTRAVAQAGPLLTRIQALGGHALHWPAIEIAPPADPAPLQRALQDLRRYDWVIFTSANAVEQVAARGAALSAMQHVAAVGAATARALARAGRPADLQPLQARSAALPAALAPHLRPGARVLLPRADLADPGLRAGLERLGCVVDDPVAYLTLPGSADPTPLREALRRRSVDYATFTSGSTLTNLLAAVGGPAALAGVKIVVLGPETAAAAQAAGLPVHLRAAGASTEALLAVIAEDVRTEQSGMNE